VAVISRVLQDLKQLDGFASSSSQEFSEELSATIPAAVQSETTTMTTTNVAATPGVEADTQTEPKEEAE